MHKHKNPHATSPRPSSTAPLDHTPDPHANPDEYNGWPNFETWCAHLWLTNEQEADAEAREIVRASFHDAEQELARNPGAIIAPRADAADRLKDWIADGREEWPASLYTDLINHALRRVDWWCLADHFQREDDELRDWYDRHTDGTTRQRPKGR